MVFRQRTHRALQTALITVALAATAHAARACGTVSLGEGRVAAIADSRTLKLEDGRLIKLSGIESGASVDTVKAALRDLAQGRPVTLKGAKTDPDRYGRLQAFVSVSGSETPIQYALLERGLVLVGGRIGDRACAQALLGREQAARAAGLGLWGQNGYRLHRSGEPAAILQDQGRFAIVEGKVLSVRESGNTIYVNFGRRWSEDFTVTIAKRSESHFISGGLTPRSLSGQTVRVRGFVEERAGPWIEATQPEQFEIAGGR